MKREVGFLNPERRLVDEVADWLFARARLTPEGVPSLAHVMVVTPTAQAGRNLRLTLARKAALAGQGGLMPPIVIQPAALVKSTCADLPVATELQLRVAFLKFIVTLDEPASHVSYADWPHLFKPTLRGDIPTQLAFFDQLAEIWHILAGGGLLMADVVERDEARTVLNAALGDERMRWQELAHFEKAFFAFLHKQGLRHSVEDICLAAVQPAPVPATIEEVVLPALVDPIAVLYPVLEHQRADLRVTVLIHAQPVAADKFDAWGRARVECWTGAQRPILTGLRHADILRLGTDTELACRLVDDFPPFNEQKVRPALGLCDGALYTELAAAFLNRGYVLHNPESHHLSVSSLGHQLSALIELYAARSTELPWKEFVAFMREDDVLNQLTGRDDQPKRLHVLQGIDVCRNTFLPQVVPTGCVFNLTQVYYKDLPYAEAFVQAARTLMDQLRTAAQDASVTVFLRRMLRYTFATHILTGGEGEKELCAAVTVVRAILMQFDEVLQSETTLRETTLLALLRKTLLEMTYSLEPNAPNAIKTEGWLELVWSTAEKVALVGFTEGAVPDSVVGHPFLPDTLRNALGLTTNVRRLARDTALLTDIVCARTATPGAVRAYLSLTNAAGDLRRPSRLLFLVSPSELALRTQVLFGDLPPPDSSESKDKAPPFRLSLPLTTIPLPNISEQYPDGRLSASAIDTWLKCPLTYFFEYGLGMKDVVEKDELEADDFGRLVHSVLEAYAKEQAPREMQLTDERAIAAAFKRLLEQHCQIFGPHPPLKIQLQIDAAEGRLMNFAKVQAFWAQDGWKIAHKGEYKFTVRPFAGEGDCDIPIKGSIDRIDFKAGVGYRLIDYKTWDKKSEATKHILKGGAAECDFANRLHLPCTSEKKPRRFISVQLPLYARCLECADTTFTGKIVDYCYALLGRTAADTKVWGSDFDQKPFESMERGKVPLHVHKDLILDTARVAIERMRGNFFWPPGPSDTWEYKVKNVLMHSPEWDLPKGTPWRDAQEAKLATLEVPQ